MRKWYKYGLDKQKAGLIRLPKDRDFNEHQQGMSGYCADEAYDDEEEFFNKYLFGYQYGRFENYNDFLKQALKPSKQILSVASGRCANELYLAKSGYQILCSDLDHFSSFEATRKLFPKFRFQKLDVLNQEIPGRFDAIVSLGLIYLFDERDLRKFFRRIHEGLKPDGVLILDSAGSTDSVFSALVNEVWLGVETVGRWIVKSLKQKEFCGFVMKHHGYRRTDEEILAIARQEGFECQLKKDYAFLTEFKRSLILSYLIQPSSLWEKFFLRLGRRIPYVRMFQFKKIAPSS